jgi:ubiquinone/menaquinone biosynthesis C-methylase UbiE
LLSITAESGLDLSAFVQSDGVYLISAPRQFAGGEDTYDAYIGGSHREDRLRSGRGAWQLIAHYATRPIHTLLEIGAGSGACSFGLITAASGVQKIITDTSPAFLQMIRRKMIGDGLSMQDACFATLAGEDLARLPARSVDAIAIASALHHVSDWRAFLRDAAALIRPGGVLVVQEPFREGNMMMGMALDFVLSPLWPRGLLDQADMDRISHCRESIYHLADSTIDKPGEDKHSFLVTELIAGADAAGFVGTAFHSNRHFSDLADADLSKRQGICSFVDYLDSFLEMHQRVTPSGMQTLRQHLFPILQRVDARFRAGDGAPLLGCMVFRR